jgi:hypothetical protein
MANFGEPRRGNYLIRGPPRIATDSIALTRNEKVKGSIPLGGSTSITRPLPWKTQVSGFFLASSRP